MATLGNTVAGASIRQINGTARGSVFTATQDGTLVSLSAYIEDAATGDTFVGVLYNANTITAATLVATTATRTDISTAGWYTFTFSSGSITNGTAYWIGVGSNSAAGANVYHDTGTGYSIGSFNPASPPGTTDLDATVDSRLISTYITYTTASGTVVNPINGVGSGAAQPLAV